MNRNRIWIFVGVVAIIFFLPFIVLLLAFSYLDFSGTAANAKIVTSAVTLLCGLIGSLVTGVGIFLRNSIDQRNANLKEDAERRLQIEAIRNANLKEDAERRLQLEAVRNTSLKKEAEKRFRLEAAIQAMKLLSTKGREDASLTQRAGVLFTLSELGLLDLAVTMLGQMLPNDRIDANTAAWLINRVLEQNCGDLSIEASGLLNEYHEKFLVDKGSYEFPRCLNLKCNRKLPKLARRNSALALLRMVVRRPRKEWQNDSLNAIIATLIFIWKEEPDREIKDGVGKCLRRLLITRAGRILHLPFGEIVVEEVRSKLKRKKFHTTTEFERVAKLMKDWCGAKIN
ncbi:MAG: hypothetical protein ACYTFQ_16400 [Planctomycetota bacterium]|jgi:hypothetical protein